MRHEPSPDRSLSRTVAAAMAMAILLACAGAAVAAPAGSVVVKGLVDAEYFETDSGSLLLSKNEGDPAGAGMLRLMAAGELGSYFQGFLVTEIEGGNGSSTEDLDARLSQAFVRVSFGERKSFLVDAGKIVVPFGNFSKRYLSNTNPLIGHPDSYDVAYPVGVVFAGALSQVDYRVAVLDKPLANRNYVPRGDSALRPALAAGITPTIGLRIGAYATRGPYLGSDVTWALPAGERWRDFDQEIAGVELSLSRGYFELNGDLAFSTYEVPSQEAKAKGTAWFVEPKYTFSPRLFAALRVEKNDYPYIAPVSSAFWIAANAVIYDAEAGVGWRFTPDLLLKASYRRDRWEVDEASSSFFPNGHSFAVQVSYGFDVNSWFERPR